MPQTIHLRAYLAKLDDLLRTNATDEAILHCRHILKTYPKNVATYRQLGRALLYNARWDEADAVLRRVLAAVPNDAIAHAGLSEIRQEQNRGNDAIWHLERALEQDPNNQELLNTLTELYQHYRNTDATRIQLTSGAVARQYARAGRYEQAAETLRSALEKQPNRLDLRVLMAEMLWEAGRHVEAAEIALDVLETLPDCLSANAILARLWLQEGRPSDAQHYVNRLESLDPYLALEIATGTEAPDDAFVLTELDYRRHATEMLTSSRPEWLEALSGSESPAGEPDRPDANLTEARNDVDFPGFEDTSPTVVRKPFVVDEPRLSLDVEDDESEPLNPDELAALIKPTSELESARQQRSEDELRFDDPVEGFEPPEATTSIAARELRTETSPLASIFSKPEDTGEKQAPDWLENSDSGTDHENDDDPLAWLRDPDAEIDEIVQRPGFELLQEQIAEPEPNASDEDDPYAWMRERGLILDDDEPAPPASRHESGVELDESAASEEIETGDDEDPFAWMRERGIEVSDEPAEPPVQDPFDTGDDTPIQDPAADPLGWMQGYEDIIWSEEKPEAEAQDTPSATAAAGEPASDDANDNSPYAWLYETGQLHVANPEAAPTFEVNDDEDNDDYVWLQDESLIEGLDDEAEPGSDVVAAQMPIESPVAPVEEESFDWLKTLEDPAAEAAAVDSSPSAHHPDGQANTDEMNILEVERGTADFVETSGPVDAPTRQEAMMADRLEDMSEQDKNPTPDWLGGQNERPEPDTGTPDWLRDFQDDESEVDAPEPAEIPDWLSELNPEAQENEASAESEQASQPGGEAEFDEFEWRSSIEAQSDAAPASQEASESVFEWHAQPPGEEAETPPVTSGPPWLADFELDEADKAAAEPGDIPDWLSELQPPTQEMPSRQPATPLEPSGGEDSDFEFGWIDELIEEEESSEAAKTQETGALQSPAAEENEGFVWADDFGVETNENVEEAGWLASLSPAETPAPASEPGESGESEFEWVSDVEAADREPVANADVPDWLKELEPETGTSAPVEPAEAATEQEVEEFVWASEIETMESAAVSETPDWLNALEAETTSEQPETEAAEEAAEVEAAPEAEAEPVQEAQPAWLMGNQPEQPETEAEELPELGEPVAPVEFELEAEDAFAPDELAFETEHRPAQNAPDWLNAMVPGVDLDYEPTPEELEEPVAEVEAAPEAEAEPVQETQPPRDFDWLNEIVEEETQPAPEPTVADAADEPAEKPASPFVFSKPPAWLRAHRAE
ncbi:MAG: tetratricopeptide repeat protein [Chloroflexota bacterium]|nr:MAG: hypothetical protein DIU68_04320 [Chloroflexota bacterium]